ncbi:MAG: hypothetical protein ABIQ93_06000 [Saprospiraceae bacterium]
MKKWLLSLFFFSFLSPFTLFGQAFARIYFEKKQIRTAGIVLPSPPTATGTFFYGESGKPFVGLYLLPKIPVYPTDPSSSAAMRNLLPKWTPESLPFFCRVEHDCGKRLPFSFKFRLGSVEYVDWLEGKSTWLVH